MKITIITLFPEMIAGFFKESIVKKAVEKGHVTINVIDLRDYAVDVRGTVDDRPYGGGPGMIIMAEPIIEGLKKNNLLGKGKKIILTSPRGCVYNQKKALEYSKIKHLVIISGHYEGVDERITKYIDEEVSVGDYILTGGELPAAVIADSVVRLIPGVLKKSDATEKESFFSISAEKLKEIIGENKDIMKLEKAGVKKIRLLEYPQYTRPETYCRQKVPKILLSGDLKKIKAWQIKKSFELTKIRRPDLLS